LPRAAPRKLEKRKHQVAAKAAPDPHFPHFLLIRTVPLWAFQFIPHLVRKIARQGSSSTGAPGTIRSGLDGSLAVIHGPANDAMNTQHVLWLNPWVGAHIDMDQHEGQNKLAQDIGKGCLLAAQLSQELKNVYLHTVYPNQYRSQDVCLVAKRSHSVGNSHCKRKGLWM